MFVTVMGQEGLYFLSISFEMLHIFVSFWQYIYLFYSADLQLVKMR